MKLKIVLLVSLVAMSPVAARAQSVGARNKEKIGRSLLEKGRYKEAIASLEEALKEEPMFTDAQYLEGLCYFGLKDYKKARDKLEYCIGLDPGFMPAYQYEAEICVKQNDPKGAKDVCARMSKVPGGNPSATYCLGVIDYELKDLAGAEKQWRDALKLEPKMARAQNNLGILYRVKEQHQAALGDFKAAYMMAPDHVNYLLNEAIEQVELGDKPGARQTLDRVERLAGQQFDVGFMAVGLRAYLDGNWERCANSARKALENNPDMTSAMLYEARALARLNKTEDARAAYKAAVESDPNQVVAARELAALPPAATAPTATPTPKH